MYDMARPKRSGVLIGTAGVYFVASRLAAKGFHAAPTFGNAPHVDILVGLSDGEATASVQVKTSWRALRRRGRGANRQPHHYEWHLGVRSASLNRRGLFFAFVDYKGSLDVLPDVFIVPSDVIYSRFEKTLDTKKPTMLRWHPEIAVADEYKNRWDLLEDYLNRSQDVSSLS